MTKKTAKKKIAKKSPAKKKRTEYRVVYNDNRNMPREVCTAPTLEQLLEAFIYAINEGHGEEELANAVCENLFRVEVYHPSDYKTLYGEGK
jgi:hypothetical protein